MKGDCLERMKEIPDKSVDMVLTDLPYGFINRKSSGIRKFDKGIADIVTFNITESIKESVRVCKGSFYFFCGPNQLSEIFNELKPVMSVRTMVWDKTNPSPVNGQHLWLSSIEHIVFGRLKGATFNRHCKGGVLRFASGRNKFHTTQKPLNILEYIIESSTNENETVLDFTMGSGSTGVACKNLNRNFIGIERDDKYFEIAKNRIEQA